ncbi:uncharacterized protein E0L32_005393 [Thyridium curvatum]|uniref:ZZ-type domain-containing protein n=1 Tax=Thyridium curvatum TaxID=1093900 RepID=A0A507BAM4_9PEZI|nr:uncharacterized protein E0L32_005393 [Thyridium curvatum]TPX14429.1 hypothetical protein E0L32_005393 [Thyridium curvatum]
MAAPTPTTPDTLINLKVNHDGVVRKFKLPLRDLGASTLEDKLRAMLHIPQDTFALIERYSDSLATYVTLTPGNISVYKQLYRAAKAKSKLKLRVTTIRTARVPTVTTQREPLALIPSPFPTKDSQPEAEARKVVPKPVSLEDVPEASSPDKVNTGTQAFAPPSGPSEMSSTTVDSPQASAESPQPVKPAMARPGMTRPIIQPTSSFRSLPMRLSNPACRSAALEARLTEKRGAQPDTTDESAAALKSPTPWADLPRPGYAVCCNSCDETIPGAHYHCSTCDDGDFDLCIDCVDKGITCHDASHWLIKRAIKDGCIVNSTTERITPKPKVSLPAEPAQIVPPVTTALPMSNNRSSDSVRVAPSISHLLYQSDVVRTCNNCISEMAEEEFVHCTTCYDFDLCKACFEKDQHGHHPKHAFVPAIPGTAFSAAISKRLPAGRDRAHAAICDSCDSFIVGVRYKCLDCPDWDYCSQCHEDAGFIHPNHRFVPIYEPIQEPNCVRLPSKPTHMGICCDGPLCMVSSKGRPTYIVGDRYKCAVCHDTDFCANCEASPANTHNKTHPLIKFKTPVRHVSVSTQGEHQNGERMPVMGDRLPPQASTTSVATETSPTGQGIAIDSVRTVVDVKPTEPEPEPKPELETEKVVEPVQEKSLMNDLAAVFVEDTITDGTCMAPNRGFEQAWTLRNNGIVAWPAGTRVKYVGGDFMGLVDHSQPIGNKELTDASESTPCLQKVAPGESYTFYVLLKSPAVLGKRTSYWRLTTPDGFRFGDRLWCHIVVQSQVTMTSIAPKEEIAVKEEPMEQTTKSVQEEDTPAKPEESSQMIFPKLDKESPLSSMHEGAAIESVAADVDVNEEIDDFEDDDEWAEDDSADGFLTDEEYDILDASDEEYLEDQQKKLLKK